VSDERDSIRQVLDRHRRLALDSNILIYLLEGDDARAEPVARIVDAIGDGRVEGVLATVGLSEVLVGPARRGDAAEFEMTAATIRTLGFRLQALDAETAEDAAWIRGMSGADLPDAIHIASARAAGATALVTNDRRIRSRPGLEVLYLDDLELDEPAS
jgi:predicted nucleic acid-binding protein